MNQAQKLMQNYCAFLKQIDARRSLFFEPDKNITKLKPSRVRIIIMSLFPLEDIIPHICSVLTSRNIRTLFVIDTATNAQMRNLTCAKHTVTVKLDCEFNITETITAGVVIKTAIMMYLVHPAAVF